jgi:hypothetical protein
MAQAVIRRPLTAETLFCARVSICAICGRQSSTGTGFSPRYSVLSCQYYSTVALHAHISSGYEQYASYCRSLEKNSLHLHQLRDINKKVKIFRISNNGGDCLVGGYLMTLIQLRRIESYRQN